MFGMQNGNRQKRSSNHDFISILHLSILHILYCGHFILIGNMCSHTTRLEPKLQQNRTNNNVRTIFNSNAYRICHKKKSVLSLLPSTMFFASLV